MRERTVGDRIGPWRFLVFLLILAASMPVAIRWLPSPGLGMMAAFDMAALAFLALHLKLLGIVDAQSMERLAKADDANRTLLLVVSAIVVAILLAAIGSEMVGHAPSRLAKALLVPTLILAWLFSNGVYALHYAHLDYSRRDTGCAGLRFPGTPSPNYWDFIYFAFTFGTSCATSDVEVLDERIRRVVAVHCAAAFAVNIGVLSFTISLIASHP